VTSLQRHQTTKILDTVPQHQGVVKVRIWHRKPVDIEERKLYPRYSIQAAMTGKMFSKTFSLKIEKQPHLRQLVYEKLRDAILTGVIPRTRLYSRK
jgi:hypothetical protein